MQQGGELEFFVVVKLLVRQFEDLQTVIERVPLGMIERVLLDGFQRCQQQVIDAEPVKRIGIGCRLAPGWAGTFLVGCGLIRSGLGGRGMRGVCTVRGVRARAGISGVRSADGLKLNADFAVEGKSPGVTRPWHSRRAA